MILGMSSATFVLVHVVISLIGIVAGIIVMFGMLASKRQPGLTAIFLLFTILTSATGFLIPPLLFDKTFRRTSSAFFHWCCWRSPASRCTA
jgi:hypothetical protein